MPIPQYISNTISFSPKLAYSRALLYNTSVWSGFTWKNDNGDISNTKSPILSLIFPSPYIILFSFPNITLVFSLFTFTTRVLNPGIFSFNTDASSFKYGN